MALIIIVFTEQNESVKKLILIIALPVRDDETPLNNILRLVSMMSEKNVDESFILAECLFVWFVGWFPLVPRLTSDNFYTHGTERGDPTSRERTATAGIEPGISSPGVARSTD